MIKGYFDIYKGNISDFLNKVKYKIKQEINYFDYFIKYIMNSKIKIYAFYYIIEENILISNDFKNILLDELKKEKNKLINNLTEEMEKKK